MQSKSVLMLGVAVTLLSAGCFGRDFARPSADSLQLGKTTYAEIVARFGSPFREGTLQINDRLLKWTTYSYSKTSVAGGVTAAEAADYRTVRGKDGCETLICARARTALRMSAATLMLGPSALGRASGRPALDVSDS